MLNVVPLQYVIIACCLLTRETVPPVPPSIFMTRCLVTGLLQCLVTEHYTLQPTFTPSIRLYVTVLSHRNTLQPTSIPSIRLYVIVLSHRNTYSLA
jgi:hypothetical protein